MSACIQAEKQCHKFKMGWIPWTPDLTKMINQILYWKGVISWAQGHRVGTSVLRIYIHKGGLQHNITILQFPLDRLQDELAKAYHWYHKFKKELNMHDMWLGQVIEAQAQATGQKMKALWKQIWSQERVQLTAKQVNFPLGKATTHHPLAIVCDPATGTNRQDCTTKQALETACLAEAGRHFTQVNQTPCFQPPLWEIFRELGIWRQAFDDVLNGTFTPPYSCNLFTQKVFKHLKQPLGMFEIDPPALVDGWHHAHKETSSSYLAIHFGH